MRDQSEKRTRLSTANPKAEYRTKHE